MNKGIVFGIYTTMFCIVFFGVWFAVNNLVNIPIPIDGAWVGALAGFAFLAFAGYQHLNKKNYRQNREYGSARWGRRADKKPYKDPVFANNVILTNSEFMTMNGRPKDIKYARNKNVLVVGGSGKTRFYAKPNIMQMHSSYVITDPKGTIMEEVGQLLVDNGYKLKVLNTNDFKKSMRYNPGDLVFFTGTHSGALVTHVGFYLGQDMMLHIGGNPNGVEIVSFVDNAFWHRHFLAFGRL